LGPQARIDQAAMESRGLLRCLQADRVLDNAGRAEIIGQAADRQDQRVIGITVGRRHFGAVLLDHRPDQHLAPAAVEPDHLPSAVAEVMPVCLCQIIELMMAEIHAAGGDRV
jgi:hypothetical protein